VDSDTLALFSMHKERIKEQSIIDDQCSILNNKVKLPPGLSSDFVLRTADRGTLLFSVSRKGGPTLRNAERSTSTAALSRKASRRPRLQHFIQINAKSRAVISKTTSLSSNRRSWARSFLVRPKSTRGKWGKNCVVGKTQLKGWSLRLAPWAFRARGSQIVCLVAHCPGLSF
jgi:hypothetical protein